MRREKQLPGRATAPTYGGREAGHGEPVRRRRWKRWLVTRGGVLALVMGVLWVSGCMERLFYYPERGPTPVPAGFTGAESVRFESGDGTRLHGWFIPARRAGEAGGRAPTIVHVHGNAGNIVGHLWFTEFLPAAGYNLFVFDYRGYGQSEGSARRRDALIADTHAALDAVLARPDVDPGRVGVFGQSLGGAIALNVIADRPEVRAAVIVSAFTSWRDIAADVLSPRARPAGPIARLVASIVIRDHRRPIDAIGRIDRPVLVLHGDADGTVPVWHGRRLAEAGSNTRLVELPGGDHNTLRDTHPETDRMVVEFLGEWLEGTKARHEGTEGGGR